MKYWILLLAILVLCLPVSAEYAVGEDFPWCAEQDLFFGNDSSDIAGYYKFTHIPKLGDTQYISVNVSSANSPQTLGTFITPIGAPGVDTIAPGLWRFRTYLYVSATTGTTTFRYIPFIRSANGTETELFYGHIITSDVNSDVNTPAEYLNSYARRNYTFFEPGDRLIIKVNVSTSSVPERTAYMAVAGNTQASMVSISYFLCDSSGIGGSPLVGGSDNYAMWLVFGMVGGLVGFLILVKR